MVDVVDKYDNLLELGGKSLEYCIKINQKFISLSILKDFAHKIRFFPFCVGDFSSLSSQGQGELQDKEHSEHPYFSLVVWNAEVAARPVGWRTIIHTHQGLQHE